MINSKAIKAIFPTARAYATARAAEALAERMRQTKHYPPTAAKQINEDVVWSKAYDAALAEWSAS